MRLVNVIGGLEEEVRQPYPMDNFEDEGHKRLCNREVEVSDKEIDKTVDLIIDDLSDRRGLKQEWFGIDECIQQEIKEVWRNIIKQAISQGKVLKVIE